MPCHHPMPAYRTYGGIVSLGKEPRNSKETLLLPCGGCLGCRKSTAKAWALRCMLELQDHNSATFTTLTYDDKTLPVTLRKRDLQLYFKKLRKGSKTNRIRFFACGEYGEQNQRPHYHAIIYGMDAMHDEGRISKAWGKGHVKTVAVTPAAIAYTAGYAAKKIGFRMEADVERVDPQTGEIYNWQPPFLQMSRRPGIGATARQHTESWRDYAILNGTRIPVPQYLKQSYLETETGEQKEIREHEQYLRKLTKERISQRMLSANEQIAIAEQRLQADRRKL